ncbi:MAG: hypothetical protein ACPGO5_03985 [Patescibacteria group bacterium]
MPDQKLTWVNFLHWYQPPTSPHKIIKQVAEECYVPLVNYHLEHGHMRSTWNIASCLTYQLWESGFHDLIENIKTLIHRGQIELVDSAAYHPILPLIDEKEVRKQIDIHRNMNHGFFEPTNKPRGFFLPECAYSVEIARILKDEGYDWIILDEISHSQKPIPLDPNKKYTDTQSGLTIVFRNRILSKSFVPDVIRWRLDSKDTDTHLSATDVEIYGHRHVDIHGSMLYLKDRDTLVTKHVSEYVDLLTENEDCEPKPSNWDAEVDELENNNPYFQWLNPHNSLHIHMWELARYAYDIVESYQDAPEYWSARRHFERGISSCTFWWASDKNFELFSGPAWKPDEVERGLLELIKSIRSLPLSKKQKIQAEKKYHKLLLAIWIKHWKHQE